MRHSLKTGFSFGLTSGIITTLGLMVGLNSSTHSRIAVMGGILTISIADSLSDALGIHISEESENKHTRREIWESTFSTFISKLLFALTFAIPVLALKLDTAILVSIAWGLYLLGIFSFHIAREQKGKPWGVVSEHILISLLVIFAANYAGEVIRSAFG